MKFERSWRWILILAIISGLVIIQPNQVAAQPQQGPILLYLRGTALDDGILIEWETAAEFNLAGFIVERADSKGGPYFEHIGFIPAEGGPTGAYYQVLDDIIVVNGQTYWYILVAITVDAEEIRYGPISVTAGNLTFNYLPVIYK